MKTAIYLRDIQDRLLSPLSQLEAAESCVRTLCKPLRKRPLGPTIAKRLWANIRTVFAEENESTLPPLIQDALNSKAKTPPPHWIEAMTAASDRGQDDPVLNAVGAAWEARRDEFEVDAVKSVARVFLDRMGHALTIFSLTKGM